MKKALLLSMTMLLAVVATNAQTLVSTYPMNKVAVIEEFTGQGCPNCPAGHVIVANMLSAYPSKVVAVGYHPTNSSYTSGSSFARPHPDAFYSTPYCGSSRFMPSAFINRREFGGEKIQSRGAWESYAQQIMAEPSSVNVGLESNYSGSTLTVNVEAYFTADVTEEYKINVAIMESNLIASQSGGSGSYNHKHVFREALTTQWGDAITEATTQGSLVTRTFTYDNSSTNYDMANVEVIVFITAAGNDGEAQTGASVAAMGGKTTGLIEQQSVVANLSVFPNPFTTESLVSLMLKDSREVSYTLFNLMGKSVYAENLGMRSAGEHNIVLSSETMELGQGMYLLQMNVGDEMVTQKLIVK